MISYLLYLTRSLNVLIDLAGADVLKFGIESKHSCPSTSTHAFKKAVVEALRDIKLVCEEGVPKVSYSLNPGNGEQLQARL